MPSSVLTAEVALWVGSSYIEPEQNHFLHCPSRGALHSQPVKQTANGGSCSSSLSPVPPVEQPCVFPPQCLSLNSNVSVREGVPRVYSSCMTRAVLDMSSLGNSGAGGAGEWHSVPVDWFIWLCQRSWRDLANIWTGIKHMKGINLNSTDFHYVVNLGYKSIYHGILHSHYQMKKHILRWKVHVVAWPPLRYLHSVFLSIAVSMWKLNEVYERAWP